jgi:RNA polymerase sigma factor (sigma-70 family)
MTPLLSSALLRAQSDQRLAELASAGHDRAFEAIVERYRRPLLRYLRRLLSDTLAEDVVQATFISAWSSLRTGTEVRDLRPWLYRIAHNAAINALKKVGEAMEEVPESAGGFATEPSTELERRDEMLHALTSIAALPSRQRAALLAVAVDGRAHAEVAEELGLTDGAVRQLVHRARTTLRMAATAITPTPFLHAVIANAGDSTVARVAEVAAGAGGASAASVSLKAGAAAVIATGALAAGGPEVAKVVHPSQKPSEPASSGSTPSSSPDPGGGSLTAPSVAPPMNRASTSSGPSQRGSSHGQSGSGRSGSSGRGGGGGSGRSGPGDGSGRSSGSSGSSGRSGSGGGERRRSGSSGSGSGSGSGNSGSGSSGSGSSGSGGSGSGGSGSGSGSSGSGGGGSSGSSGSGSSGETRSASGSGVSGGGDELAVSPAPADSGDGGDDGGSGDGDAQAPAPAPASPAPAPAVSAAPPPAPDTSGSGSSGSGSNSGSGGSGSSGSG